MNIKTDSTYLTIIQICLAVAVTFFWAICFPFIELGHRAATPLQFATLRALIASIVLLVPMVSLSPRMFLSLSFWKASLWIGLTYTAMGFSGMFLADGRIATGMATVLTNIQPFLAAIIAYFVLSEKLTKHVIKGLIIGFLGVLVIAYPSLVGENQTQLIIGIGYILLGALGTAFGTVLMKKYSTPFNPLRLAAGQLFLGSIVLFVITASSGQWNPIDWHPSFILSLLILAIPGTAVAVSIWIYLLKYVAVTRLNVFTFLTPVFGLAIGLLFFNERISLTDSLGIVMIFVGLYIIIKSD